MPRNWMASAMRTLVPTPRAEASAGDGSAPGDRLCDTDGLRDTAVRKLPGVLADRYQSEGQLGRGTHCVVYAIRHPETGWPLALKVSSQGAAEHRWVREIRLNAGLSHDHLLNVYDGGVTEDFAYLVMERGAASLEAMLGPGDDLAPAWRALRQVSEAVDYLHAEGVVHRDIKPSNILMTERGACLSDLGLCRARGMGRITDGGVILGTPGYMAPEQARGEQVGPEADVFSLGVLAYQALEGHLPYSSEDPLERVAEVARGHLLPLRWAAALLSRKGYQLLVRALSPLPADRPKSLRRLFSEHPWERPDTGGSWPGSSPGERARRRQVIRTVTRREWPRMATVLVGGVFAGATGAVILAQVLVGAQ